MFRGRQYNMIRRCLPRAQGQRSTLMDAFLFGELRGNPVATGLPTAAALTKPTPGSSSTSGATLATALAAAEWTARWCSSRASMQVSASAGSAHLVAMLQHVPERLDLLDRVSHFVLRQPNPAQTLGELARYLQVQQLNHIPGPVARYLIDALRLQLDSAWQIAGWCVALEIIAAQQSATECDCASLRLDLTRGSLAVVESHPSRPGASRLLGAIARVCPVTETSLIDRIVAQVGGCVGGPGYTDVDDLVSIVELAVRRPVLDATVAAWWRWLQHTRFVSSNRGLSAVLLALARERHGSAATFVVQLLCSRGASPSVRAQIAFLDLLAAAERPPVQSVEFIARCWSVCSAELFSDRGSLLCSLAKVGRKLQEPRVVADAYRGLMECNEGQLMDLDVRLDLLRSVVDESGSASPSASWVSFWKCDPLAVLQATVKWCQPAADDRIVALVVRLAHRLERIGVAADWLSGSTPEAFEASLQRILASAGFDGADAVRNLCAAAGRPVPDALAAWIQLLGGVNHSALDDSPVSEEGQLTSG